MANQVINPYNGEQVAEWQPTDIKQLPGWLAELSAGQQAWRQRSYEDRRLIIERFNELLQSEVAALARRQTLETGKPISQATGEIKACQARIAYFCETVPKVLGRREVYNLDGMCEQVSYEPLGVIGNISAWNYPYFVSLNVIIPALLTGNAVLFKPSEYAFLVGQDIVRLLHKAGVPQDVLRLVAGDAEAGQALSALPLAGMFFTGSYPTGAKIAAAFGPNIAPLGMELGGNDPVYVHHDVAVAAVAAQVADGAFYNAGQSCCAVERIYAHGDIYDDFVRAFVANAQGFKGGDPLAPETYIGPLTRYQHVAFLEAQVADAVAKGAQIACGGGLVAGSRQTFAPTVLLAVNHDMLVMTEETFGPVIGIQKVADQQEALALMADNKFGLTAAVYSEDQRVATAMLESLAVGSAYWNCSDRVSPRLPWSGRRLSGLGATLGEEGIRAFVAPKAWHFRAPG